MMRRLTRDWRPYASLILVALVGVLHRNALASPWADDRPLAWEPAWFQLSAPVWHAAIPGSSSMAQGLTLLVDPLSNASALGDARAIAAMLTSLIVVALLYTFRNAKVSTLIAPLLCLTTVGLVLPVSAASSLAYAIQTLAAACMLLTCSSRGIADGLRPGILATATIIGALNHPAFVAFAAGIWITEAVYAAPRRRVATTMTGVAVTTAALLGAVSLAGISTSSPAGAPGGIPGTLRLALALMTGHFPAGQQVTSQSSVSDAFSRGFPGPLLLCLPLAVLGFLSPLTRRLAVASGLSAAGALVFTAGTWLPDPTIAAAPAKTALVLLSGLGLSWVGAQPNRGARPLAIAASAFLGIAGFFGGARAAARAETAEMQAFVDAAVVATEGTFWSANRLATSRAILSRDDAAVRSARVWGGRNALDAAPDDRRLVAFDDGDTRLLSESAWIVPRELRHGSAASFLTSQTQERWLAVALRGNAAGGFCRSLLDRLRVPPALAGAPRLAVLARAGGRDVIASEEQLDLRYGERLSNDRQPVPAHFQIETEPMVRISVNGQRSRPLANGMAITIFDPWRVQSHTWLVGDCRAPSLPTLVDRRLKVADVIEAPGVRRIPPIPFVTDSRVDVPVGEDGNEWFASGWHPPELPGPQQVRWTGAPDAHMHVLVSHRQPLRVRMTARLAVNEPNGLTLSWNGSPIAAAAPSELQGEWMIPATLVRRGLNVLTLHVAKLVSPASLGPSSDTRLLGAAVSHLSIEPAHGESRP